MDSTSTNKADVTRIGHPHAVKKLFALTDLCMARSAMMQEAQGHCACRSPKGGWRAATRVGRMNVSLQIARCTMANPTIPKGQRHFNGGGLCRY